MSRIQPVVLIRKYYANYPEAFGILLEHSRKVTRRAVIIARHCRRHGEEVDLQFIAEAAMLHDIGILFTDTPELGCPGKGSYLLHGIKGARLLRHEKLPKHARVCERHIGVGLTAKEIRKQRLPLPQRDMCPETLEEQIICYADLFYSKGKKNRHREKQPDEIRKKLKKYGHAKIRIFDQWLERFEPHLD